MTFSALRISHGQVGIGAVLLALNHRPVLDPSSRPRPRFSHTAACERTRNQRRELPERSLRVPP